MYFASLTKIMRDLWLYQTVLGFSKAFSYENEEGILIQAKGTKLLFEIKKRKVKN